MTDGEKSIPDNAEQSRQRDRYSTEGVFVRLLVAAQPRIFGYIVTLLGALHEAEEVMQETSIVMWEKFDDFTPSPDDPANAVNELVAWGNQIAFFKVLNLRRKHSKSKVAQLSDEAMQLVSEEWIRQDQTAELEQRRVALKDCLAALPESQRDLLKEYYWGGQSVRDIADQSSRTADSIYKLLQRTRAALYKCINGRATHPR